MSETAQKKRTSNKPAAPAVASSAPAFMSDEAEALTLTQISAFLAHTNNQAVVNELESVLKSARNQVGWKHAGRLFLQAITESAFAHKD